MSKRTVFEHLPVGDVTEFLLRGTFRAFVYESVGKELGKIEKAAASLCDLDESILSLLVDNIGETDPVLRLVRKGTLRNIMAKNEKIARSLLRLVTVAYPEHKETVLLLCLPSPYWNCQKWR